MTKIRKLTNQIFLNNKYTKWYFTIIEKAISENRIKHKREHPNYIYYEQQHIIPKSICPEYRRQKWNIVLLTAHEHFVSHLLLTKMVKGSHRRSMAFAFWGMCNQANRNQKRFRYINGRIYQYARELISKQLSDERNGKTLEQRFGIERARRIRRKFKKRSPRKPLSVSEKLTASKRMIALYKRKPWPTLFSRGQLPPITCPVCYKHMDPGNYSKHGHGPTCRQKPVRVRL